MLVKHKVTLKNWQISGIAHISAGLFSRVYMDVFILDEVIGGADEVEDGVVGEVAAEIELHPVSQAAVERLSHGGIFGPELGFHFWSHGDVDISKVIYVYDAEHMPSDIEHQHRIIPLGKLAKRGLLGHIP